MDDLEREKDEEDEAFDYKSKPGPSRSLPIRSCKTKISYNDKALWLS